MERRIRRSGECSVALGYQLDASSARAGLDFMVLASEDGFLVASSGADRDQSEEVAARLASLGLCAESHGEIWRAERTVTARVIEVLGERLILGAGSSSSVEAEEMERAMRGVARILISSAA